MPNKELINKYFWNQYHGLVRAIDLPQWYKVKDKRISCVNCECFSQLRDNCLFWERYLESPIHIRKTKEERKYVLSLQKNGINRNVWDKLYGKPNYYVAAFSFCPEQKGCECKFFENK